LCVLFIISGLQITHIVQEPWIDAEVILV